MNTVHVLLVSLLLSACSSSPEATQPADNQHLTREQLPTTDTEPGPVVIVEPPEPEQTEPLATEVDVSDAEPQELSQPEPPSPDWCSGCSQACIDYVAMLQACKTKLPTGSQSAMAETIEAIKSAFRNASTPEAQKAMEPGCRTGLDALQRNPSCR